MLQSDRSSQIALPCYLIKPQQPRSGSGETHNSLVPIQYGYGSGTSSRNYISSPCVCNDRIGVGHADTAGALSQFNLLADLIIAMAFLNPVS